MIKIKNKPYLILMVLTLAAIWFFVGRFAPFGTNGDWNTQHSVIPEQFRQQFYATGQLFPEFAAGLGGGQNIYNFSYYGLYSPIVLLSYLLPFVKMSDYLMIACAVCLTASVLLMYYWLGVHGYSKQIRFLVSMLFLLAAPMICQSHRQIMFVDYMPFLCMAFIGVDRYWKQKKPGLYIAGVFLMIMTSFYFSIAGILALCFYGVSRCEAEEKKERVFGFIVPTAAAVAMAGILLVPTAYALFARTSESKAITPKLFYPDFSASRFTYSEYGIGLTAGILVVLFLCIICKNLKERFLSIACLSVISIPFFSWVLNGGLYARGKSLIPFLPVLCYLSAACLEQIRQNKISARICLIGYFTAVLWFISSFLICGHANLTTQYKLIFTELILLPVCFIAGRKTKLPAVWLLLPSVLFLFATDVKLNELQKLDADFYQNVTDTAWKKEIEEILDQEPGLYRLEQSGSYEENKANINRTWDARQWSVSSYSSAYHKSYRTFRETFFQTEQPSRNYLMQPFSENPLFQKFMGIKYLVKKNQDEALGKTFSVIKQEHAAPILYATDQVISEEAYQKMTFPYNQTTLMKYAVAKEGAQIEEGQITGSLPGLWNADIEISENASIHKADEGYSIKSKKDTKTTLFVKNAAKNAKGKQILFLQFDVKNKPKNKDVIITLENIRNNLCAKNHIYYNGNTTFTYVLELEKNQEVLNMNFHAGTYSISNIKSFLGDASILKEDSLYQSKLLPDCLTAKGNEICGELDVKNDGYLVTSIPFDHGFEIKIDGRRTETETVNTAFLGTKISKGRHRIELTYHAPGVVLGKTVSAVGIALWALVEIWESYIQCFVWSVRWSRRNYRSRIRVRNIR